MTAMTGRRVVGSPGRRVAGSPGRRVAGAAFGRSGIRDGVPLSSCPAAPAGAVDPRTVPRPLPRVRYSDVSETRAACSSNHSAPNAAPAPQQQGRDGDRRQPRVGQGRLDAGRRGGDGPALVVLVRATCASISARVRGLLTRKINSGWRSRTSSATPVQRTSATSAAVKPSSSNNSRRTAAKTSGAVSEADSGAASPCLLACRRRRAVGFDRLQAAGEGVDAAGVVGDVRRCAGPASGTRRPSPARG